MKKIWVSLIVVLILLFIIVCNFNSVTSTVKDGTYVLEKTGTNAGVLPRVIVSNEHISFIDESLSSYLPIGAYKIRGNKLTMTTDDRFGVKITDNAKFKLEK